jgi:predicted ATPase
VVRAFAVEEYRSLRRVRVPLGRVNVITGPNGSGKSNLYQALHLAARAAHGDFSRAIGEEGGSKSVMWAGGERGPRLKKKRGPVRLVLSVEWEDYHYSIEAGYPSPNALALGTIFTDGIEVKRETLAPAEYRRVLLLERDGPTAWMRDTEGRRREYPFRLYSGESALSQLIEPHLYPEISAVRHQMLAWRFYHQFRTDAESPLRQPEVRVQTTVLRQDGRGLACALRTIQEIGDDQALAEAVAEAFQGGKLKVVPDRNQARVEVERPGLLRPLQSRELSDGQLRFLCLAAALLSPRMPPLLALNEPESSLHPDLLPALARLVTRAGRESQVWVTTHSVALAQAIAAQGPTNFLRLRIHSGETQVTAPELTEL